MLLTLTLIGLGVAGVLGTFFGLGSQMMNPTGEFNFKEFFTIFGGTGLAVFIIYMLIIAIGGGLVSLL